MKKKELLKTIEEKYLEKEDLKIYLLKRIKDLKEEKEKSYNTAPLAQSQIGGQIEELETLATIFNIELKS